MNALSAVATFYKQGGIFMNAVLVLGILIIAIIVERMIVIGRAAAVDGHKLTEELVRTVAWSRMALITN